MVDYIIYELFKLITGVLQGDVVAPFFFKEILFWG